MAGRTLNCDRPISVVIPTPETPDLSAVQPQSHTEQRVWVLQACAIPVVTLTAKVVNDLSALTGDRTRCLRSTYRLLLHLLRFVSRRDDPSHHVCYQYVISKLDYATYGRLQASDR